ncbi:MAG: hypothetical protein JWM35_43 [Verrucomicrobia bacterium]|nr:hypothetical protein [Verrucomicrobiota bacterium]
MKTKLLSLFLVATGALALGARAQQVTVPTPAPVVDGVNPSVNAQLPAPNRIIYSPRLPSPTELTNVAAAQGLGIERIDQTADQITVTYKKADGQLTTVAYQLLGSATQGTTPRAMVGTTTIVTTPAPTVVYEASEPDYYYNDPYYYPWGYYSPVSLSLGFGYYRGFGGYHGGFGYRGGYGYRGGFHGGHRR